MPEVDLNYWAILVAGVASYVIGMVWYMAMSKPWMKLVGLEGTSKEEMKKMAGAKSYIKAFIAGLIMAWVLAHFVQYAEADTLWLGALTGFWAWLGFVATTSLSRFLWEPNSPKKLWLMNNGNHLLGLLVMGAILATWVA